MIMTSHSAPVQHELWLVPRTLLPVVLLSYQSNQLGYRPHIPRLLVPFVSTSCTYPIFDCLFFFFSPFVNPCHSFFSFSFFKQYWLIFEHTIAGLYKAQPPSEYPDRYGRGKGKGGKGSDRNGCIKTISLPVAEEKVSAHYEADVRQAQSVSAMHAMSYDGHGALQDCLTAFWVYWI